MTHDENAAVLLHTWWNDVSFSGKNCCGLQDTGALVLYPADKDKERILVTLTPENADAVIDSLVGQFTAVREKVMELQGEWDATGDKQKMADKVHRCRVYLSEVQALGNYTELWQQVQGWEQVLHDLSETAYKAKLQLVQQAEAFRDSEDWKEVTQFFRNVAEQWKQTGFLSRKRNEELWKRLENARTRFFDRKRAHHEAQEEDMLLNLDIKLELVEKAEALSLSGKWKETSEIFRHLMDEWKAAGRTMTGKNEELWQRFIAAKNTFYDRKKEHYEQVQQEQEANCLVKNSLVEKAESLKDSKDWTQTSQVYAELTELWKQAGKIPAEKVEELRNRFFAAKEYFFDARRKHYETVRSSLEDNYQQKKVLLGQAEALRDSDQWHTTTEELNRLMAAWKQIGPVPHKYGDTLWKQFIDVRTAFFKRKDEHRRRRREYAEQQHEKRKQQAFQFLQTLQEELKEEESRLADFREGVNNITPGHKEEELRAHLRTLIAQSEHIIERKQQKIAEVQQQLESDKKKPDTKNEAV